MCPYVSLWVPSNSRTRLRTGGQLARRAAPCLVGARSSSGACSGRGHFAALRRLRPRRAASEVACAEHDSKKQVRKSNNASPKKSRPRSPYNARPQELVVVSGLLWCVAVCTLGHHDGPPLAALRGQGVAEGLAKHVHFTPAAQNPMRQQSRHHCVGALEFRARVCLRSQYLPHVGRSRPTLA